MTLCTACNYPIPSWQHQGACKPVEEKVPRRTFYTETVGQPAVTIYPSLRRGKDDGRSSVTETVERVTNSRGRPRVTNPSPAALKQRERRAKRKQGES